MMHFNHKLYRNHQKGLAYSSHLSPLILFFFTKDGVKRGEGTEQCPPKYASSVGKYSGLGLAWGARHCWTRFLSSASPLFKSKPLCRKTIQDRNFVPKKKPEYTLSIFFACIYCYLLGLTIKFSKMTQLKRKLQKLQKFYT